MKTELNFNFPAVKLLVVTAAIMSMGLLTSCDTDDPIKEDTPELITKATLNIHAHRWWIARRGKCDRPGWRRSARYHCRRTDQPCSR